MVTLIFWLYLEIFETDIRSMNTDQIKSKLYFDLVLDVENWNHSVPLILLCVEYMITSIPFNSRHFVAVSGINVLYLCFLAFWSINYGIVYKFADWNNKPQACALSGGLLILISYLFFLML